MAVSTVLCNNGCCCILTKFLHHWPRLNIIKFYSSKPQSQCSSNTDAYVENLISEEGIKRENKLTQYFQNVSSKNLHGEMSKIGLSLYQENNTCGLKKTDDAEELASCIEEKTDVTKVPNEKLGYLLVYFTKDGNVNGVKAIQSIIKKHNASHFQYYAQYNHYLAEALWLDGKVPTSLNLFSFAYDNTVVRPKVKVMLPNLFTSLVEQHSEATLHTLIYNIEQFSGKKRDDLLLACLWRELYLSTWFSDQEEATKLLLKNSQILKYVQWMVPTMGKMLLKSHRVEDCYRLIQFTLTNNFTHMTDVLIRLLFEYYYIHENLERCTAVVKYSSSLNSPLTEDQQRRYISLLLKSKDTVKSKSIVKKPQDLKYTF
ncbi:uncharacterized protein LOC128996801 [Macrosteles quadrilineatus]|uniref:uncharacterized protein LOC128996801 n=1 Tax=Macrosteles quadrilineatus TaxID=74068 RepID=UPI0023E0D2E9|nr:uncharacterized protein LOC128996801 [Macrosteles quadrilineatus]